MKRLLQDEGWHGPAGIAAEAGFTLIELLVTMFIAVIVLGFGTYGLSRAFQQSTDVSSRTASTNQAEVGFQQLTHDLRYATICPTYSGANALGVGGQEVDGVLVSAGPELQMCDPVSGTHITQPPALALVTWTCNTATAVDMCTRSLVPILCPVSSSTAPATGACTSGAPSLSGSTSGSSTIYGVTAITFSGIVSGSNQANLLSDTPCRLSGGAYGYGLTTSSTCPLTWVGLQTQLATLTDPSAPGDSQNSLLNTKNGLTQLQTGVALGNYGT